MRALTGFVLVALVAVALGCGGSGATTTTAPPSTTATTLAPTTTTPVGSSDVQAARAQLKTDVAALKASLEGLRTLSLTSTKADLTAARDNVEQRLGRGEAVRRRPEGHCDRPGPGHRGSAAECGRRGPAGLGRSYHPRGRRPERPDDHGEGDRGTPRETRRDDLGRERSRDGRGKVRASFFRAARVRAVQGGAAVGPAGVTS